MQFLNQTFAKVTRPEYLGEILCTDFKFGDNAPSAEVVDIRDLSHDFLIEDNGGPTPDFKVQLRDEQFTSGRPSPERRFSAQTLGSMRSIYARPIAFGGLPSPFPRSLSAASGPPLPYVASDDFAHSRMNSRSHSPQAHSKPSSGNSAPSLQLHVHVAYSGTLRIGLHTELLVNYPSPLFMALPLSLCITGLAFSGTFVVAYEDARRHLHISLLDPATEGDGASTGRLGRTLGRPGERLLTELVIESEVGQAEKHVLRNVGKVEKFVLEVARGALEVFPAFAVWLRLLTP